MVRVRFDFPATTAVNVEGRWQECDAPPLLADLRRQAAEADWRTPDIELAAARQAIRAFGGRIVFVSYPRPGGRCTCAEPKALDGLCWWCGATA